jgi:DNA-binding transcriptional regulator YdaS (Cro superfamily)
MHQDALHKAVQCAGGQSSLARKASQFATNGKKLTQAMVWKWLNQAKEPVPPGEWVIPIETAVAGQVTRHELRSDLYPKPDSLPADGAQARAVA